MPVEIVGQQLRIRMTNPDKYEEIKTDDVGKPGGLQRIAGYSKRTGWETQAWRLNLDDYTYSIAVQQVRKLKLTRKKKQEALRLLKRYYE